MESFTDIFKCFRRELAGMGYIVGFRDNTLVCIMREGALNEGEIKAIRSGKIRYGIFIKDYIPFILFDFSFGTFEFPVNVHAVFPGHEKFLENYNGRVSLMVYDCNKPRLVAGRSITINKNVIQKLKASLNGQLKKHRNVQGVNMRIIKIEDKLSVDQMAGRSSMFQYYTRAGA